jgi:hypothetical protein
VTASAGLPGGLVSHECPRYGGTVYVSEPPGVRLGAGEWIEVPGPPAPSPGVA